MAASGAGELGLLGAAVGLGARGALTAGGGMVAYRIITSDQGRNFISNAARGLPARGPEVGNALIHRSLSLFDSLSGAASRVPGLAQALADKGNPCWV